MSSQEADGCRPGSRGIGSRGDCAGAVEIIGEAVAVGPSGVVRDPLVCGGAVSLDLAGRVDRKMHHGCVGIRFVGSLVSGGAPFF